MKEIRITQTITPRESENITRYLNNIASTHPLDPDQEADLAIRIRKGDLQARNELVTANLRFVVSVAKQYQNVGAALDEMASIAYRLGTGARALRNIAETVMTDIMFDAPNNKRKRQKVKVTVSQEDVVQKTKKKFRLAN